MDVWQFAAALLGGGFGGGLVHLLITQRAESRIREAARVREQLRQLYGPLAYLVSLSEVCSQQGDKVLAAGGEEYAGIPVAPDARETASQEIGATIGVVNEYTRQLKPLNDEAFELVRSNYLYIDEDDQDIFLLFAEDHVRGATELDSEDRIKLPWGVYQRLEPIPRLRQAFRQRVKEKFALKQQRLAELEAYDWWTGTLMPSLARPFKRLAFRRRGKPAEPPGGQ